MMGIQPLQDRKELTIPGWDQDARDKGVKFSLGLIEYLSKLTPTTNIQSTLTQLAITPIGCRPRISYDENSPTEMDIRQRATSVLTEQVFQRDYELNLSLWRSLKRIKSEVETDPTRGDIDRGDAVSRIVLLQRALKDSTLIPYFEDIPWEALKYTG